MLNKDIDCRENIIFGEPYDKHNYQMGGIRRFKDLSVEALKELLTLNFIDPSDRQNMAPSAWEIFYFMQKHPKFTAQGYAVDISRGDYRVSLEGVNKGVALDADESIDFINLFRHADEFDIHTGYAWYD